MSSKSANTETPPPGARACLYTPHPERKGRNCRPPKPRYQASVDEAARMGWKTVNIQAEGRAGATATPASLEALVEAARDGAYDVLVIRALNDFQPDVLNSVEPLIALVETGITLWLVGRGAMELSPGFIDKCRAERLRKNAIAYLRAPSVSEKAPRSLDEQAIACLQLCERLAWNFAGFVQDDGERRPNDPYGVNAALNAKVDVVIVDDLAALTSSTNLLLWLISNFRERGVELAVAAGASAGCDLVRSVTRDLAQAMAQKHVSDQAIFADILENNPTALEMIGDIEDLRGDLTDFVAIETDLESRDELIWLVTDEPITAARLAEEINALHHG